MTEQSWHTARMEQYDGATGTRLRDGTEAAIHYAAGEKLLHFPGAVVRNPDFPPELPLSASRVTRSPQTRSGHIVHASSALAAGLCWSTTSSTGVGAHPSKQAPNGNVS